MLILTRYLTVEYFKVFLLSLLGFLMLLIVSRLEEIASYATLGTHLSDIALFTLCQITAIVPLAIPLSCLISSFLLFQRLSESGELTVLRSSGFSLAFLLSPLLASALFLSLANFALTSEVATRAHLATRTMLYDITSSNPLILLQNASTASYKGAYVEFSPQRNGKEIKNLLLSWREKDRLHLLLAQKVKVKNKELLGKNVTLLSSSSEPKERFLALENQEELKVSAAECASFIHQKNWKIASDHLTFNLLKLKIEQLKIEGSQKALSECYSDIFRRFSLGCTPLSFTLMGSTFGIKIGRRLSKKKMGLAALFSSLTLLSFFMAKAIDHKLFYSAWLFIFPHLLLLGFSSFFLRRYNQGRE